jgi:hypothetical protein
MIRGAILTLGAIVTLAGLGASWADDLSLFDWPSMWPAIPEAEGLFPKALENWNDLPLRLHVTESVGYNSNIANTPSGTAATSVFGRPIGALESISNYGASFKEQVGGQQFFADGNWGMYRYLNNANFNTAQHSFDIGDNFTYGSKCSGTLRLSQSAAPSLPGQQLGINVINTATLLSATESATCIINGEYSGVFNSGFTNATNSASIDQLNNYQSVFVAAGINYVVSQTNSLQLLATVTGTNYTDRQVIASQSTLPFNQQSSLLNKLTTSQVMATYTKNISPMLSLTAQIGLIGVNNAYFSFAWPRTILPQYAFNAQWTPTPRLGLNASVSRLASAPTSVLSNLQITESASAGVSYQITPKMTAGANVQASYSTGAATPFFNGVVLNTLSASERSYSAGARLNYIITPFLDANLSYQFTKTVQSGLTTNNSLILLALNFNPY